MTAILREARILCPLRNNSGETIPHVAAALCEHLALHFGGYTGTQAHGGFIHPNGNFQAEPMAVFDVAIEDTAENADKLRTIAQFIAVDADQVSVYIRHANGVVELVAKPIKAENDNVRPIRDHSAEQPEAEGDISGGEAGARSLAAGQAGARLEDSAA